MGEHALVASAGAARDAVEAARDDRADGEWQAELYEIVRVMETLEVRPPEPAIMTFEEIKARLAGLATDKRAYDPGELAELSSALGEIIHSVRVPGVPRPEDADWAF